MSERWIGAIETCNKNHQDVEIWLPDGKIVFDWDNLDSYYKLKRLIFEFAKSEYNDLMRQDDPKDWMVGGLEYLLNFV